MACFWTNPVSGLTFETYIFDFDQEIYGWHISFELVHFYRDNQAVNSLEELTKLLAHDEQALKAIIKNQ